MNIETSLPQLFPLPQTSTAVPEQPFVRVTELFYSIQGESTFTGRPCGFIRLAGCGVGCRWCDTLYAVRDSGTPVSFSELQKSIRSMNVNLVEITGGEPLEQAPTPALALALSNEGYTVLIETAGAHDITPLEEPLIRIMDIKCPGSGPAHEKIYWENLNHLRPNDEIKFVIADRADYHFAVETINAHSLCNKVNAILFSAVQGELALATLAGWVLEDHLPVRIQTQLHKQLWPDQDRGV